MIYGKIYANAELNMLPIEARYLYIGTLVLADDDGRLRADSRYLRGQIFSFDEGITSANVETWLSNLHEAGQIDIYEADGVKVLLHPKWKEYQKIRSDMYDRSKLPPPLLDRNEDVTGAVHKLSKDKLSKDKETAALAYLTSIPIEDLSELTKKYDASSAQVKRKAEQMANYCAAKGKAYKNYRAFLENGLDRDFGRRPAEKTKEETEKPLTPDEKARVDALKGEISSRFRVKTI